MQATATTSAVKSVDGNVKPLGYEQVTGLTTAKSLTVPDDANAALIQAQDKDIRWRDDGTDPTASVGMVIAAGTDIWYTGDLSALRLIEVEATAKVNVSYYYAG